MTGRSPIIEINIDTKGLKAVTFSANSEYLVGGGDDGVQVWRMQDGKQMATMQVYNVQCVAVSKDGRWIAAGTRSGMVFLWDAKTYEQVWKYNIDDYDVATIDFSPDSTRLINVWRDTATVLDVATGTQVQTLNHCPDGTRIATATHQSVQVWDSSDGRLLFNISSSYIKSLLWFDNHSYVISRGEIKRFQASTWTELSRWTLPRDGSFPCIVVPRHGEFIAYTSGNTVTCWDTSTHTQLSRTQQPEDIISLALSPDDRFLAIGLPGKITVHDLTYDLPLSEYRLPFIHITNAALRSWEQNRLVDVEASLTESTSNSPDKHHLALATRALVRSQLQHWDLAIEDAEN
ncbi:quinon protein alcohol dehydrogenase-like superfamily, partial [Boletus edulis]